MDSGLKQEELAKRLGVHQSFVSKVENGERRLDVLELRDLCEALGIGLSAFINSKGKLTIGNDSLKGFPATEKKEKNFSVFW